ncbi:MAG: hypothetical protein C4558_09105 [Dehalococcoidia bacterium]|nr:MAG: hypothetical protein C4558_09105 [Dehalococcoidia bacterium]
MNIYGQCLEHTDREATHAVTFKDGRFEAANDRFGEDSMTVALADIVFCEECAVIVACLANARATATGVICDTCGGPALFHVSGNADGDKCIGHVEKYRRGRIAQFYRVERLSAEPEAGS